MPTPNILIVDDHILFSTGIEQFLQKELNAVVVIVNNPIEALGMRLNEFDIILVDMDMPEMKGYEFINKARLNYDDQKYLIVSMHRKRSLIKKAINSNVNGYILKDDHPDSFIEAIKTILNGSNYFSPGLKDLIDDEEKQQILLSPREEEVLKLQAHGRSMSEISDELFISLETVKTHIRNIKIKLDLDNKADVIKYAIDNLLV
ncbi:response regulator transcription factor [Flammeovirga yaeyamensis]|uniref:Response regulator transcription factor n=1 Tax=Flammeovirga yaeyamensis TaxID=367791 RepID=A0AAX1N709_9BACT|nr:MULTISPECIES: response regulator transcription factor [Flammeovirga]ANQ49513.1 response regulator transcription factor [Flammeovirga sp. MY04]MBB3697585.1 DNA-binding NarL/FixJ family response regulator [Flammeovirga yaeyamensis]NMF36275.1 response regulator transcription factor [Flammeovirga yaeyamensis]QWG03002.1 response regulator transcription factor [Flammeovirga yaeyamensis]